METLLHRAMASTLGRVELYTACWGLLIAAELFWSQERQSVGSRVKAGAIWLVSLPAVALMTQLILAILPPEPLLRIDLREHWVIAAVSMYVVGDFLYYWYHRAMHSWFWPLHAVHHSIREVNAVSAYIHPLDDLVRIIVVTVPMTLLFRIEAVIPVLVGWIYTFHGHFIHTNSRLNLGPLRWIIVDNRYHRLHHSILPQHHDCNFANTFAIWDVLFGTAVAPKRDEWPETGLKDRSEPGGVGAYLMQPFRRAAGLGPENAPSAQP